MKNISPFILFFLIFSCKNDEIIPEQGNHPTILTFEIPKNFPNPVYNFSKNPISQEGFELGRALFNDPILSRDNSISCAECHNQQVAFTHHNHALSHGIDGKTGFRNALPIQNVAWYSNFFWDGGVHDLDLFPPAPIENPIEMDENLGNVLRKLQVSKEYPPMFKKAFGSDSVSTTNFLFALSQFMNSLVSSNSKYDKVMRKEGVDFSRLEKQGYEIFKNKCSSCHSEPLFTNNSFQNNGLKMNYLQDFGRYRITEREEDKWKFKVPSLRNIEFTAPYMHDGRFASLDEVLNHYSSGIVISSTLNPNLKNGISLTSVEKDALIAFLKTLTDKDFLTNPKFSTR